MNNDKLLSEVFVSKVLNSAGITSNVSAYGALGCAYIGLCDLIINIINECKDLDPVKRHEHMLMVEGVELAKLVVSQFRDVL